MKSIERIPVVQQVADNIKEYIVGGTVQVGEKLPPENTLCQQLGVGRGTVREAFRILQANGFVEIKPGRGAFVARTSELDTETLVEWFVQNEVELRDCIEIRTALEPLAVRLTVERATETDLAQIQRVHDKFLRAVEDGDALAIAKYDEKFHSIIVDKSRNKLLISINRQVNECVKSFRSKTFRVEKNVQNAIAPHSNIMQALLQHNEEAGADEMHRHLEQVLIDLQAITDNKRK